MVEPAPGESFHSWLIRLAAEMNRPPGLVVDDLGLKTGGDSGHHPVLFGISTTVSNRTAVHAATGISGAVFDAMHLSVYDGTVLDLSDLGTGDRTSLQRVRQREWALFHNSRACPECLGETGGVWKLWWQLGAAAVCPVHRLMLVSSCPNCGLELQQGSVKHQVLLPRTEPVPVGRCGNRFDGRLCLYPLEELTRVAVGEELCAAQVSYLEAAHGRPRSIAGHRVNAVEWSQAFKAVCGLARFVGRGVGLPAVVPVPDAAAEAFAEDVSHRAFVRVGRAAGYRGRPRTAALATALLAFAGSVLEARDGEELRCGLRPLGSAVGVVHPFGHREGPRTWPMPGFLSEALLSVGIAPKRLTRSAVPVGARGDRLAAIGLEFWHLPRVVAGDDYWELIASTLSKATPVDRGGRFAALVLARLCGAQTWHAAGVALGWTRRGGRRVADGMAGLVSDPKGLSRGIELLAIRLRERGPVDFQRRREVLSAMTSLDASVWAPVFARNGFPLSLSRNYAGAAWLWAELTCGEMTEAPALADPEMSRGIRAGRLLAGRQLVTQMPAPLAEELLAFGRGLLDAAAVR